MLPAPPPRLRPALPHPRMILLTDRWQWRPTTKLCLPAIESSVKPPGRFPSECDRPWSSLIAGIFAEAKTQAIVSFKALLFFCPREYKARGLKKGSYYYYYYFNAHWYFITSLITYYYNNYYYYHYRYHYHYYYDFLLLCLLIPLML